MYYLAIWLILAFSAIFNYLSLDQKSKSLLEIVCYFVLVFTSGLRFETGTDYLAYVDIYNGTLPLSEFSFDTYVEPLYALLNSFFVSISVDINLMFLLISIINTAVLFNSIKLYIGEKYYLFAVVLYYGIVFFLFDMSGIRQAIAFSIFLYSIRYVLNGKPIKFVLLIFFAFCFHRSAILLCLVYPMLRIRIKSWLHYVLLFIGLVLIIAKIPWLSDVLRYASTLIISGPLAGKIIAFITNEYFSIPRTITSGLLIYVPVFIIGVWKRKELECFTPYFNIILNLSLLHIICLFYLYESNDISIRFSSYFSIAFTLIFPLLLNFLKQNKLNLLMGFSILLWVSIFAMRYMIIGNEPTTVMYRPYQNYIMYQMGFVESDAQKRYENMGE